MKNLIYKAILINLLFVSASFKIYAADDNKNSFSTKIQVGIENDSNVAIEELDRDSREGDSLLSLGLNLDYENKLDKDSKFSLGYSYSSDSYDEFDQFDLATNSLSANYSQKLDKYTLGGSLRYIVSDLDSEKFLTLGQGAFNVSRLLDKTRFLRAEYTYTDKELDTFTGRDSSKHGLAADVYFFLDGSKKYWVLGYKYEDEDAESDELDRSIHSLKANYTQKFPLFGREARARFKSRYQIRDYDSIIPSIGEVRDDDRLRLGVELEINFTENWFVLLEYELSDYESNLSASDYDQSIVALKVGWQHDSNSD